MIAGYDWPRLHAALNDLPLALLSAAVAFEIAGVILLVATSQQGGRLTFDHALGVSSARMKEILRLRGEMPAMAPGDTAHADSTAAPHHHTHGADEHAH